MQFTERSRLPGSHEYLSDTNLLDRCFTNDLVGSSSTNGDRVPPACLQRHLARELPVCDLLALGNCYPPDGLAVPESGGQVSFCLNDVYAFIHSAGNDNISLVFVVSLTDLQFTRCVYAHDRIRVNGADCQKDCTPECG